MIHLLDPALQWSAAHPRGVQLLADITSGGDGTSNGAINSLVSKGILTLGVLTVLVFGYRVFSTYAEGSSPGGPGPGGGGGTGGGKSKKLVEELKHFAIAVGLLVAAYSISDIVIDVVTGWFGQ
ncbi:hypothetical protein [Mycobacterium intracellulare]|uniref:Integral membrane protein n=1 Tax=Mycobacterium intracellulare subsp. chimaera TaxID=222805 RepID=A0ABT7P608_MYCIT|nr:hypothetical protein [Mycobacterium intracellulare]MDM3928694.1 hypothetical protein [Mycobacterium intracellulare subsp. chimaera]